MKKTGFIAGVASALLGATILVTTNIIGELMPKIGYMAFQKLSSGSYTPSDYAMNFTLSNTVAVVMIAAGLALGAYCFISEPDGLKHKEK